MTKGKIRIFFYILFCCLVLFQTTARAEEAIQVSWPDGEYAIDVSLEGGSGKASVETPTLLMVEDGAAYVQLVWSSSYYDYMMVNETRYENLAEKDMNATFKIPIYAVDEPMQVIADTTAMGEPHEISYELTLYSDSITSKDRLPREEAKKVIAIAIAIIVVGGILNGIQKKRVRNC